MYLQMVEDLCTRGFEERGLIGEGAFGKVYRVREKVTKKIYACKLGVGAGKEHVCREMVFLKEIRHPLFAGYIEGWEKSEYACLIMEHVAGTNLEDFIRSRNKLSETQTLIIATELAEGLLYLHKHSIVFRDVKAQNIVIRQDGRVKLLDFGCACLREEGGGGKVGTIGFAPLEQLGGEAAEAYNDVYALGKVMQYMLSGINPSTLQAKQFQVLWEKQKHRRKLKNIVNSCVKEKAWERLPNMCILLKNLRVLCQKRGVFLGLEFVLEKDIWKSNYKI